MGLHEVAQHPQAHCNENPKRSLEWQYISAKKKPNHISMSRNHCNRLKPAHAISTGDPSSSKGS